MRLNRKWILVIALVMSLAMATGGTLAYLQSSDTETNTFTVGSVKIDLTEPNYPGNDNVPTLLPGVEIEKDPQITNTSTTTPAWVWMEITMPNELYNTLDIEWDNTGYWATPDINTGASETVITMKFADSEATLAAGATTEPAFTKISLDKDITKLPESLVTSGTVDIVVNAYAIQDYGFNNITEAMAAYNKEVGGEPAPDASVISVASADEFVSAFSTIKSGDTIQLSDDIDLGDVDIVLQNWSVTGTTEENGATVNVVEYANNVYNIDLNTHKLSATNHAIELHGGTLNIKNGTISMDSDTQDGTFITVGGHSPVYDAHKVAKCGQDAYNPASVLNLDNVTFEGSTAVDGGFATSGHAIYVTCHGQVHIRNCTFDLVMENGVYANPFDVYNNASDGVGDGSGSATVVYVYEGTKFYGDPTYQAWKDAVNTDWEVNGGIRVYIADGYTLEAAPIADGDTYAWYTVVAE